MALLLCLNGFSSTAATEPVGSAFNSEEVSQQPYARVGLQRIHPVTLLQREWNDGDSFAVRFPDGEEYTLRLYGVDCIEDKVRTESDARRMRDQRRHFGIAGGEPEESVRLALRYGLAATERVEELLAEPFTVYTAFADGRGDPRFPRILAFVTTSEGRGLSEQLVFEGLARAFGIARSAPDGSSQQEFRDRLADLEMVAASRGSGVWAHTDWENLPDQRRLQRAEADELAAAIGAGSPRLEDLKINPNTAARRELEQLPGVGEIRALAIIEGRDEGPYLEPEDLLRVPGIGPATLDRFREGLSFD